MGTRNLPTWRPVCRKKTCANLRSARRNAVAFCENPDSANMRRIDSTHDCSPHVHGMGRSVWRCMEIAFSDRVIAGTWMLSSCCSGKGDVHGSGACGLIVQLRSDNPSGFECSRWKIICESWRQRWCACRSNWQFSLTIIFSHSRREGLFSQVSSLFFIVSISFQSLFTKL